MKRAKVTPENLSEALLLATEQRLQAIIDAAPYGAHLYELQEGDRLVFSGANRSAERILGVDHRRFVGKTIEEAFPALTGTDIPAVYRRVAQGGQPFETEQVEYDEQGIRGAYEVHAFQTGPGRMAAFFLDITERKQAELALRESEERYRRLLNSVTDYVYTVAVEAGRSVATVHGPGCLAVTGFTDQEFAADPYLWFQMIHGEDRPVVQSLIDRILAGGEALAFEHRLFHKDGTLRWVRTTLVPYQDAQGRLVAYDGIVADITERKEAEEEIRTLNEQLEVRVRDRTAQLEYANQELESFSYSVSHDLRAPLRAIDGFTRILVEDLGAQFTEEARQYLEKISKNARRMGALIDDLLLFSRLSRQPLRKQRVAPAELVRRVVADLTEADSARSVELVIDDLPPCAADPNLLQQVFANLLDNAFKYTRKRELGRIEVGARQEEGRTVYFIQDNGAGFDMNYVDKLFGVFQRLHRPEEFEGTGVGLAIVQMIVQRHGGRVWAMGEVERGATFSFTLE